MKDLIDRAEVIGAMCKACNEEYSDEPCEPRDCRFVEMVKALPSAQPEVIRCRECKFLSKWRSEKSAKKFGQLYDCGRDVLRCPTPDDFCSRAERREDG